MVIQEQLEQLLGNGIRNRRESVSLHSITAFARSMDQKDVWEALRGELHSNGVTADMIEDKKEGIFKIFRTTNLLSTDGGTNDSGTNDSGTNHSGTNDSDAVLVSVKPVTLHQTAEEGHVEGVKLMLDRGASINKLDTRDRSALLVAAGRGHATVVKLLLDGAHGLMQ